jgi:hypothetical protein
METDSYLNNKKRVKHILSLLIEKYSNVSMSEQISPDEMIEMICSG